MSQLDFSKLVYDISKIPTGESVIDFFPELGAYTEFESAKDDNEIKIAILLSDFESPFIKIKDIKQKSLAIFKYLNIELNSKVNKDLFEKVLNYQHERIFGICGSYLQIQNNHDFTHWWNLNQLYYSLMIEMGKPRETNEDVSRYVDRKLKIQKQSEPIKNDLLKVEAELFSDSKMKMAIAKSKITQIRTSAEKNAQINQVE